MRRQGDYVVPDLVEVRAQSPPSALEVLLTLMLRSQRAVSSLLPKLPDLHADALSRLYTVKSFQEKLGSLCLPNVKLSERDCEVLAGYLSKQGHCAFDGKVSCG